jgi:hypothetical protein
VMHKLREMVFDNPVIRERSKDGLLLAAGFTWREPVMWVFQIFGTASFPLLFYWLMCMSDRKTPAEFTTTVFIGLCGCVCACIFLGSISRGIAFERDGRISNRGGWVNWLDLAGTTKDLAHIASIEAIKTEQGIGVAMFTIFGGTVLLSEDLSEAKARLAAVQLTAALREMRQSLTTVASYQSGRRQDAGPLID